MAYQPEPPAYGPQSAGFATTEDIKLLLNELRSIRLALTFMACDGGRALPSDFEPQNIAADMGIVDQNN
jgi:hypothetical protein